MKSNILGLPLPQAISLFTFLLAIISIWVHMEIRLAELNVEITNLKQDLLLHKTDNTRNFDIIRSDIKADTKEILKRIDEIQIYLRNPKQP
ncbi:MAG: hypothetical protein PHP04_11865 [Bacteroidales bacterium]|nr:hypothetical protein [Bacteroidales bacterium]